MGIQNEEKQKTETRTTTRENKKYKKERRQSSMKQEKKEMPVKKTEDRLPGSLEPQLRSQGKSLTHR